MLTSEETMEKEPANTVTVPEKISKEVKSKIETISDKNEPDNKTEESQNKMRVEEIKSTKTFLALNIESFKNYLGINIEKLKAWIKEKKGIDLDTKITNEPDTASIITGPTPQPAQNLSNTPAETTASINNLEQDNAKPIATEQKIENVSPPEENPAPAQEQNPIIAPENTVPVTPNIIKESPIIKEQVINEKKEVSPEDIAKRQEIDKIIDELGFEKEICDEIKNIIKLDVPEKLLAYGQSFDEIAYTTRDKIFLLPKAFEKWNDENGIEHGYDKQLLIGHELGHFFTNHELIYSKNELSSLNDLAMKIGPDFKLTNEERSALPKGFAEIYDLLSDNRDIDSTPDHLANKESGYIISLIKKMNNDGLMQKELERHNNESPNKISSIDDLKGIYRAQIANEVIAERISLYLPSKNKASSFEMLVKRVEITPNLQKFMGIDDKDFNILKDALKEVREKSAAKSMGAVIATAKSKGMSEEKLNSIKDKINIFGGENQIFFERFRATLGKRKPEEIKAILRAANASNKENDFYDDEELELDELLGGYGNYYGEPSSFGSRGGEKGFISWIVELFSMLFNAK